MRLFIADFETTPFKESLDNYELQSRFVCFISIETKERFFFNIETNGSNPVKDFIISLFDIKNPVKIYFHNLRFDLAFLMELLPKDLDYKYSVVRSGSKIIQFKIYKTYKRKKKDGSYRDNNLTLLDIRDSFVLFPVSIEKLGSALGFPKLEIDYTMKEISQEYIDYCFRDIEILEKSLYMLVDLYQKYYNYDLDIYNLPLTLPALSKRVFHYLLQKRFGKNIMYQIYDKNSEKYESKLRNYYYGGRVEVFDFNCCFDGYYNDFNSMYPAIMKQNEFPLTPYKFIKCNDDSECWKYWNLNKNVFGSLCELTETLDIPLVATKVNDKLVFAKGKKEVFLFRKEIEYLLALKQKIKLKVLGVCNGYLPIFDDYIDITYKIKKESKENSFDYLFSKLVMNSLYGKFAEKKEKEKIEIIKDLKLLSESELLNTYRSESGLYIKRVSEIQHTLKINIIYSMMITALARLKLHQEIMKSKKPYYADTDSIVSADLIENSKELGHLKPEFQFHKFQALGCKEYIIENNGNLSVKFKGFGKLTADSFERFISVYRKPKLQNRMIGFMEAFNRNMNFNLVLVYDKYKMGTYDKRWILPDLTTKAFDLEKDDFEALVKNNEYMLEKIINSYKDDISV